MADNPFIGAVQVPNYSDAIQGRGNAGSYAAPLLDFSALSTLGQPQQQQQQNPQQQAQNFAQGLASFAQPKSSQSQTGNGGDYASAISSIESGGNYQEKGPVTSSGDRAYGKYQIMGQNIPGWTAEVNRSSGAAGIGQWLGERKHGFALGDFDSQLSHAADELVGSEKSAGDALRRARTKQDAAIGASMYERAEGYDWRTGRDAFVNKTMKNMNQ